MKTKLGDKIVIHYTAFIDDSSETDHPGRLVDTTYNEFKKEHRMDAHGRMHGNRAGHPFEFTLGKEEGFKLAIKAFDEGLMDMCVGERRVLTIPPELGFGPVGTGPHKLRRSFPPVEGGATLRYLVELVAIRSPPPLHQQVDVDGQLIGEDAIGDGGGEAFFDSLLQEGKGRAKSDKAVATRNVFAEIDLDRDQRISHEELHKWFVKQHRRQRDEALAELPPGMILSSQAFFRRLFIECTVRLFFQGRAAAAIAVITFLACRSTFGICKTRTKTVIFLGRSSPGQKARNKIHSSRICKLILLVMT